LVQSVVKFLAVLFIFLLGRGHHSIKHRPRRQHVLLVVLLFLLVSGLASCGGGAGTSGALGTGSGVTIQLAVQGTSGNTTVTLDSVAITIP
jgi:hypothetical protein